MPAELELKGLVGLNPMNQSMRSTMGARGGMGVTWAGGWDASVVPPDSPVGHGRAQQGGSSPSTSGGDGGNSYPRSHFGSHTLTNYGKGGENQDMFVTSTNATGSKTLVGVFDGHGEHGRKVSEFSRNMIAKVLFSHKELQTNPKGALEAAFTETQRLIERSHSFDAFHSGTTAIAVYQHRDRIWTANVGDSRAVLGCCGDGSGGQSEGSWLAVELSSDQKPHREDERRRILAEGGNVHQSAIPIRQGNGPARLVRVGPERVWDRAGRCGLCVTRSLGDLGMRPFVVAYPEIFERRLAPNDKLLILGSDGIWDRIGSQEAVDIAVRHRDPAAAARELAAVARKRWHTETQGQLSDDITAVVVRLDHGGADGGGGIGHSHGHGPATAPPSAAGPPNVRVPALTPPTSAAHSRGGSRRYGQSSKQDPLMNTQPNFAGGAPSLLPDVHPKGDRSHLLGSRRVSHQGQQGGGHGASEKAGGVDPLLATPMRKDPLRQTFGTFGQPQPRLTTVLAPLRTPMTAGAGAAGRRRHPH